MTEIEIRATISKMRAPERVKEALLEACLAGDPRARFCTMAIAQRRRNGAATPGRRLT